MQEDQRSADVIAKWLDRKAKNDPKIGRVLDNARLFGELKAHPAWSRLYEIVKANKQKMIDSLARDIWADPNKLPTPEEISYRKGFYQGAVWILAHPEKAEASLDMVARAAWLLSRDEELDEEDDA